MHSYSLTHFLERLRRSGYLKFQKEQQDRGGDFAAAAKQKSYQLAPRATIFRRDAGDVTDLDSLKRLMRSNNYQNDPVSPSALLWTFCAPSMCGSKCSDRNFLAILVICQQCLHMGGRTKTFHSLAAQNVHFSMRDLHACAPRPFCCGLTAQVQTYICLQYSDGKALNAICGRGDLDGAKPRAYGCYDSKVANFEMARRLAAQGIVGPAGKEAGLKPFEWTESRFENVSHQGQPRVFDFKYEPLSAELLSAAGASKSVPLGASQ